MYWQGENRPKTAETDIPVVKIGIKNWSGIHPCLWKDTVFVYEEGKVFKSAIKIVNTSVNPGYSIEITDGLHCYLPDKIHSEYQYTYGLGETLKVTSFSEPDYKMFFRNGSSKYEVLVVLLCSIPKGTVYYENKRGEVVTAGLYVDSVIEADLFCRNREQLEKLNRNNYVQETKESQ